MAPLINWTDLGQIFTETILAEIDFHYFVGYVTFIAPQTPDMSRLIDCRLKRTDFHLYRCLFCFFQVKLPPMMEIITAEQLMEYLGEYKLN